MAPVGQLAFGPEIAALGYQYTRTASADVRLDWVEVPAVLRIISNGTWLSRMEINGRVVFVQRKCASALLHLWGART
ncbi:hypothetical protein CCO02nite_28070 [Cellulomonas composti]|uniref:Uncharacterized protein n=1 Tax=Cellulomonas composti TaxID=266130 RepID=A0A511JED3_9CELL|nr:hypothetical protein CCO02nite_28070 [Cellulomonas composti]